MQKALFHRGIFKQAIQVMGETIDYIDEEIDHRDNEIHSVFDVTGISNGSIIQDMEQMNLIQILDKTD